jgi:hypothetical protein
MHAGVCVETYNQPYICIHAHLISKISSASGTSRSAGPSCTDAARRLAGGVGFTGLHNRMKV